METVNAFGLACPKPLMMAKAKIGEGARELSSPKANLVVKAYEETCERWNVKGPGFALWCHNIIPLCRGLGSSAGAVVAGVLIAKYLTGYDADDDELLRAMTMIEGHPDNVAPCFLGGMVVSCWDGKELRYVNLPPLPPEVLCVVAVPDERVKTSDARKALPKEVPFGDAVFNVGRAALLTAVGLLPLAAAGVDIQALMDGAAAQMDECLNDPDSAAVRYALKHISLFGTGAQFYLINVVSDYAGAVMPDMAGMALPALSEEEVLELQKDEFNEAVEPLRPLFAKAAVATKEICLVGNAGDEIAAFAKKKKLDLVVMGSHGYGRFKAAVMGSTATRIAATGDVPLLIIRQA